MNRRNIAVVLTGMAAGTLALLAIPTAQAQAWPDRSVRVVVPAPAGSSLDIIIRTIEPRLVERWKQPLVV